jgi:superfamily II DNA or RNA helicase
MQGNPGSYILGLSGTLSEQTELELLAELNMPVILEYTLDQAINDGIISDYKIHIIKVNLDDTKKIYKKNTRTEKAQYRAYSWVIENKGHSLMLNLGRMRVIHNSLAKTKATIDILDKLRNQRALVFCANNKVAKLVGCKLHTSKFNNQEDFEKFITGKGSNHLAVCKIGNTGVSFKSLDHIVVNAFDSNSENLTQRICRSLILDAPSKVSNIYIISSTEKAELKWLEKALEFFNKTKINYL